MKNVLILLLVGGSTPYADEVIMFDQGEYISPGLASQFAEDYPFDWMAADDFTVDAQFDDYYLTRIDWWGSYDANSEGAPEGFYLLVFEDDGGIPLGDHLGDIHYYIEANPGYSPAQYQDYYLWGVYFPIEDCNETGVSPPGNIGSKLPFDYDTYTVNITVVDKFRVVSETTYWFCAQRKMYYGLYYQWGFCISADPNENGYPACYLHDEQTWYLSDNDLSFQLYGSQDPGGIESKSLGEIKATFR